MHQRIRTFVCACLGVRYNVYENAEMLVSIYLHIYACRLNVFENVLLYCVQW